jgi:membrane protease YdiL (CAAX protease family)
MGPFGIPCPLYGRGDQADQALPRLLAIYFLPSIVAWGDKKDNARTVLFLNVFLGWTGIGWLFALILAFRGQKLRPHPVDCSD